MKTNPAFPPPELVRREIIQMCRGLSVAILCPGKDTSLESLYVCCYYFPTQCLLCFYPNGDTRTDTADSTARKEEWLTL